MNNRVFFFYNTGHKALGKMSKNLSQKVADLKRNLECPVCLSLPKSTPIYQCENGHIICNACRERVSHCPQCNMLLGKIRCLTAESFIDSFFIPCPFAKHGCDAWLQHEQEDEHKKSCEFRETRCPIDNCNQKMSKRSRFLSHLMDKHEDDVIFVRKGGFIPSFNFQSEASPKPIYVFDKEIEFLIMARKLGDYWHLWTYCIAPSSKSCWRCKIKLRQNGPRDELLSDRRVVSNEKSVDDVMSDGDTLIITDKFAQKVESMEVDFWDQGAILLRKFFIEGLKNRPNPPLELRQK